MVAVTAGIIGGMEIDPVTSRALTVSELGSLGFANKDHTTIQETLNGRRSLVFSRVELIVSSVTATSSKPLNVVDVFDGKTFSS